MCPRVREEVQDCSSPAASLWKKKVAKRPGYMRADVVQQTEFLPHPGCETFNSKGLEHHGRTHYRHYKNCSWQRHYNTELTSFQFDTSVNRIQDSLNVSSGSQTARDIAEGLNPLSNFGILQSDNQILPANPVIAVHKGDTLPGCTPCSQQTNLLENVKEMNYSRRSQEKERMYALDCKEVNNNNQESENKHSVCNFSSTQDHFNSHFSFIQQSLYSASETSDVRHPSNCSEKKVFMQTCGVEKAENASLHPLVKEQRTSRTELWASSNCMNDENCKCPQGTAKDDQLQDCERLSLLHANTSCCCSTDSLDAASAVSSVTSGYESSNTVGDHNWDSLMKKYEPVLQECLQGNQNVLKMKLLIRKLQRLQEKAVAEDDYERANKFRKKLQELEKEKRPLKFQLPSRHPSVSSFLNRFRTQLQITLNGDSHRFNTEENHPLEKSKQKISSLPYCEKIQVPSTKRDQLFEEKEWIQKEMEALKARLVFLEAKDQQLSKEIEEQDKLIQAEDSELSALLSWLPLHELQAIGKALAVISEASHNIPCSLDLPESIKRLQEKEHSLNMSIKDTVAKVCNSQKLCSTLRRKVSNIETQLPALLEAKILAVSGANFCTAKDLAEEIKSLRAEKEWLEELLNEWSALSAKNVKKLEKMKESYKKLKEEMEQEESVFEKKLTENAFKYMEVLEEKLQSCGSQFLERVWEVDLEACQLLIQQFHLKEGGGCASDGEESQTDEVEDAADASWSTKWEQSKHFPIKDSQWSVLQCPVIQSKHPSAHWERKEESHILPAELDEKCEKISEKLMHVEDQLQKAVCSCDEALVESLQREIQMVKETLQAMLVQLQPAKEAEDDAATALLADSWYPGRQGVRE
nr:disrupted in schizophrenia 1 protein isoform X1 [Pogona vitticeps]